MTPETANQLAFSMVKKLLGAAHGFELIVDGTPVRVTVGASEAADWPQPIPGLPEEQFGPWPSHLSVHCEWEGGRVAFWLSVIVGRRENAKIVLSTRILPRKAPLGFTNVSQVLLGSDEPEVPIPRWFFLKKRGGGPIQKTLNKKLRTLVAASGLPMLGKSAVELFRARVEDGALLPSEAVAFERLIHVALLKLDFFSRGRAAQQRGRALFDLASLGVDLGQDEGEDAEEEERRHWAGGYGDEEGLRDFLANDYWQLSSKRDDEEKGAQQSWARFAEVQVGDWFAIKGFGGDHHIAVHYVGEVVGKNEDEGRLDLKALHGRRLYEGPAPRGSGAASWFDMLVPITREDVVELLFGEGGRGASPALAWTGPKNVILYGPPGTGKTYRLRDDFRPRFTREAERRSIDLDRVRELSWFEIVAAALADQGGQATAMELRDHTFVKAKYQSVATTTPVLARIWGNLQGHAVEGSTTVNYGRRYGRLVFDKRADGTWFFPNDVPEDIAELSEALHPRPAVRAEDYVFVTFHQSYAYEDFIEGIRPKTAEGEGEGVPSLTYELEDGVFLRAANAAVRLAGFDGTIDELCRLPADERTKLLEGAPPYGVFIDEINRGNVSRIFGELITLLEEDKRLGEAGEIIVTLPYSRRRFGVPSNLCLIGTMNTADRSVETLDAALRRRFSFIECPPDPTVLDGTEVEGGVDVGRMLRTINARLEVLLDRDHLIGHAHFMPVRDQPTIEKLKEVFAMNILPLLSEYFYADLGRVGLVLGRPFVSPAGRRVALAAFDHEAADQLADRVAYRLRAVEDLTTADFRSIYESTEG